MPMRAVPLQPAIRVPEGLQPSTEEQPGMSRASTGQGGLPMRSPIWPAGQYGLCNGPVQEHRIGVSTFRPGHITVKTAQCQMQSFKMRAIRSNRESQVIGRTGGHSSYLARNATWQLQQKRTDDRLLPAIIKGRGAKVRCWCRAPRDSPVGVPTLPWTVGRRSSFGFQR